MGRSSAFGGQQYTHAIWPGDLDSDYHTYLEDDYWVGGLPTSVIAGLTLGASGFPFYAADTGGFRNERPTQEVLTRWAWQSAFSPIMQIGGGGTSHFPWAESNPDEPQYDEQGIEWMRKAAQLNIRLADYRFTWGLNARQTGAPLMRPFGMSYPQDGRHPSDTYLLGPDLLVAPAMSDAGVRDVPLPEGIWMDLWSDELVVGPASIERQIALGTQAVFIRGGAIIPLLDEQTETLSPISIDQVPQVKSRVLDPGLLTWLVALQAGEASLEMVNHDGASLQVNASAVGTRMVVHPAIGSNELPAHPQVAIDLRFDSNSSFIEQVRLDGVDLAWINTEDEWNRCDACLWSPRIGRLLIKLLPHDGLDQVVEW